MRRQKMIFSTVKDVYFLTVLPFCRMALPMDPWLPGDERVGDLVACHCMGPCMMLSSFIWIEVIEDLLTEFIIAMVVRIYRSSGT
jgi:hypothetical protein